MAGAVKGELEVGEDRVGDVPGPPQVAGYQPVGLHLHLLIYHHHPPLPVPALQLLHNHVGVAPIEASNVQLEAGDSGQGGGDVSQELPGPAQHADFSKSSAQLES